MSDVFDLEACANNIRVVLVNTSHPGNIGAVARAMKNMGITKLTLVDPESFPSAVATGRAVSAVDILENAVVTETLAEAVRGSGLVIGASARQRSIPWPLISPVECAARAVQDGVQNEVALVFGREDSGLSNEELQLCHFHVNIPADEKLSSLNLAAAVMVICYEVRMELLRRQGSEHNAPAPSAEEIVAGVEWDVPKATGEQVESFYTHLERVMVELNFHDPDNPRLLMMRMRRLFGRIRPDQMEISVLRGFLAHVDMLNERVTRNISVEQQRQEKRDAKLIKNHDKAG